MAILSNLPTLSGLSDFPNLATFLRFLLGLLSILRKGPPPHLCVYCAIRRNGRQDRKSGHRRPTCIHCVLVDFSEFLDFAYFAYSVFSPYSFYFILFRLFFYIPYFFDNVENVDDVGKWRNYSTPPSSPTAPTLAIFTGLPGFGIPRVRFQNDPDKSNGIRPVTQMTRSARSLISGKNLIFRTTFLRSPPGSRKYATFEATAAWVRARKSALVSRRAISQDSS